MTGLSSLTGSVGSNVATAPQLPLANCALWIRVEATAASQPVQMTVALPVPLVATWGSVPLQLLCETRTGVLHEPLERREAMMTTEPIPTGVMYCDQTAVTTPEGSTAIRGYALLALRSVPETATGVLQASLAYRAAVMMLLLPDATFHSAVATPVASTTTTAWVASSPAAEMSTGALQDDPVLRDA